ncbi:BaiN/RdsA family NAD(P)/FAD-dependent oxidoreductase [Thioclava electrotropha]|uniref:NAD(P)/FAD-dependent oxidoreductase n=1 Tax=Thioclava electrotropha TaxID=1549850 RepID=A0ABX6YW12_9RHOB|nr:NAD(P)/FAD-dependent oxidoreductase [Thioclava electrotropha]QPZ92047.1 NAD(P)/FAD-dependent oxidoreductase [Thioclava electrotropha]
MENCDVLVLGAGAAGLMAGIEAARRGRSVQVLDHARRPGEKIRISGGGRCNFTNRLLTRQNATERFLSRNPRFALSALSRYTPADFIARLDAAGIAWHEKHLGQLFCDGKATQIIDLLLRDLRAAGGVLSLETEIERVEREGDGFLVTTSQGPIRAASVIVATGGKSIPKMGASSLGYEIAQKFGLDIVETRPALVPLTFAEQDLARTAPLSGLARPVDLRLGKTHFAEDLLFTHRGLSGPAILQISSYWREGDTLKIDLAPGNDIAAALSEQRDAAGRQALHNALARHLPEKLAHFVVAEAKLSGRLAEQSNKDLAKLDDQIHRWQVRPVSSEGYRTAEVTLGGVSTVALDAKTMESKQVPGLYFIGEVVDVTGWLGGYNFQWAWASGWAAGQVA